MTRTVEILQHGKWVKVDRWRFSGDSDKWIRWWTDGTLSHAQATHRPAREGYARSGDCRYAKERDGKTL